MISNTNIGSIHIIQAIDTPRHMTVVRVTESSAAIDFNSQRSVRFMTQLQTRRMHIGMTQEKTRVIHLP